MIFDRLRNNPRLTIKLFVVAVVMLILSTFLKGTKDNSRSESFSGQKTVTVRVPKVQSETLSISTSPKFDFTYSVNHETLSIRPIDSLIHKQEYVINVKYKDEKGQDLAASTGFLYEDTSKAAEFMNSNSIHGSVFDLTAENRYTFLAYVTIPDTKEENVKKEAEDILRAYGIDPNSVDLKIEYSRSARGDGIEDPFSPVL